MSTKPSGIPWIGSVPSHWEVVEPRRIFALRRMGELSSDVHLTPSQKYGVLPQSEYMEITGNRVVQNLSGNTMQHVEAGDFISHLRTFQGGLELARTPGKVSPAYTVVDPRSPAHSEYYKYVLKSAGYISQIASVTDQLRDGQSMRYSEFNHTWLPLPPLDEQQIIADYLDHETAEIDAFVASLSTLIRLSTERAQASIAFRIDDSSQFRDSTTTRLGHVVSINEGLADPRIEPFSSMPLIAPNHIEPRTGRLMAVESAKEQGASSGKYLARPGQVIYSKIRPALMKATIAPYDCLCSADMYPLEANENWLSNEYLLEFLLSSNFEQFAVTMSDRVAMPKLNRETLTSASINLPPQEKQKEIVGLNRQTRESTKLLIDDAEALILLARERRSALISAAVTGQIDVTSRRRGPSEAERLESELARAQ